MGARKPPKTAKQMYDEMTPGETKQFEDGNLMLRRKKIKTGVDRTGDAPAKIIISDKLKNK